MAVSAMLVRTLHPNPSQIEVGASVACWARAGDTWREHRTQSLTSLSRARGDAYHEPLVRLKWTREISGELVMNCGLVEMHYPKYLEYNTVF